MALNALIYATWRTMGSPTFGKIHWLSQLIRAIALSANRVRRVKVGLATLRAIIE